MQSSLFSQARVHRRPVFLLLYFGFLHYYDIFTVNERNVSERNWRTGMAVYTWPDVEGTDQFYRSSARKIPIAVSQSSSVCEFTDLVSFGL